MRSPSQHSTNTLSANSFARLLVIVLFLAGLVRASLLILADPVHGYADQGDAWRTGACVGVKPATAAFASDGLAGTSKFLRTERADEQCVISATVPFLLAAVLLDAYIAKRADSGFDIRFLGVLYFVFLLSAAVAIDQALHDRPRLRVAHALIFAVVLCDPAATLYFNTLLSEPSALIGFYGLFAALAFFKRAPVKSLAVFVVCCSLLVFARAQHFALAIPFGVAMWMVGRNNRIEVRAAPLLVAIVLAIVALSSSHRNETIRQANRTNAVMHTLAPAATDPIRFVQQLGLPESCSELVGSSWYVRYGHDPMARCPTLGDVRNLDLVKALLSDPKVFVRMLYKSLLFVGNVRLFHLGEVSNSLDAGARKTFGAAGVSIWDRMPQVDFQNRVLALAVLASLAVLLALSTKDRAVGLTGLLLMSTTGGVLLTSLVGDGYSELTRHAHLAALCLPSIAILAMTQLTTLKDLAIVVVCLVVATLAARFAQMNVATHHVTPYVHHGTPGLLVLGSQPISEVSLGLNQQTTVAQPTRDVPNVVLRILGLPKAHVSWIAVPNPIPVNGSCTTISLAVRYVSGQTSRHVQCVKAIRT